MILVLFCRWTQPEVQFRLLHRLTGQGLTARFICCKKTILGNDPKRIRHLPVPCGKGQFLHVCYCDQAHVTWGSCGSKQPYLKCCGFFFFQKSLLRNKVAHSRSNSLLRGQSSSKRDWAQLSRKWMVSSVAHTQGLLSGVSSLYINSDILHTVLSTFLIIIMGRFFLEINLYSRLPIIQTFKGNRKKFDLSGVDCID